MIIFESSAADAIQTPPRPRHTNSNRALSPAFFSGIWLSSAAIVAMIHHYGKPGLRRVFRTHGEGQEAHGKAFAVRFSWKRTAKRTRRQFAW
jgi:hypothetical protein